MINKIIIVVASSLTIALISFGIYSARELVTRTPVAYWELETAYNSFNYGDTYMLLIIGIGIGIGLMTTLNGLLERGE